MLLQLWDAAARVRTASCDCLTETVRLKRRYCPARIC